MVNLDSFIAVRGPDQIACGGEGEWVSGRALVKLAWSLVNVVGRTRKFWHLVVFLIVIELLEF